jgi:hypothetical protein
MSDMDGEVFCQKWRCLMVSEYYLLVSNYQNQDKVVFFSLLLAVVILAGWWLIKKFGYRWLNMFYVGQMLVIYLIGFVYFSGALALLPK